MEGRMMSFTFAPNRAAIEKIKAEEEKKNQEGAEVEAVADDDAKPAAEPASE